MNRLLRPLIVTLAIFFGGSSLGFSSEIDPAKPALLPMPQSVKWGGEAIPLPALSYTGPKIPKDSKGSNLFIELKELFDLTKITHNRDAEQTLELSLGTVETPGQWKGQENEAYKLVVKKDGIKITANQISGLYYGLQTLRQLIVLKDGKTTVAACEITDFPAFKIRGVMQDVGRNFQSIEQLKTEIDVMAAYKMNIFHWHLTDHFGWRLESKKYPDLQSEKAFERQVGKFYTQKEFKELSDYCWARGMIIIPEFDSPGHSGALRRGLGIDNMKNPAALAAMVGLFDELCTLADKQRMPYIHIGTDEVRHAEEYVNDDYLPKLHEAIYKNDREVIGWVAGMTVAGDTRQIQQTWAQSQPIQGMRHIDSRANYINHMEALDFVPRMLFQQPCRVPHGDEINLGGILAHWPDVRVDDEKLSLTNNPVLPAIVAYSEAVWKGIEKNRPEFWAKLPEKGTAEFAAVVDFENRLAEQRDRFMAGLPFPMVKSHEIEWRLLGPVAKDEIPDLEAGKIEDVYQVNGDAYRWTKPLHGGAIHVRHFFGFEGHLKNFPNGKDIVWANTFIHSDKDQTLDAWISFNTTSTSDNRAGAAKTGSWNPNALCDIWINGQRVDPPKWKNPGKAGNDSAFIDEVYTSRVPTKIDLKKGWNKVLIRSAPSWKWVFSFSPIKIDGNGQVREVSGIHFSTEKKLPEPD